MRRRRLKRLCRRLGELQRQSNSRDELMLKLGAARKEAGRAWSLVDIAVSGTDRQLAANGFSFRPRRCGSPPDGTRVAPRPGAV